MELHCSYYLTLLFDCRHIDYFLQSQLDASGHLRKDQVSHPNIPFVSSFIPSEPLKQFHYDNRLLQSRSLSQELFCPIHPDSKLRVYKQSFKTQGNMADLTCERSISCSSQHLNQSTQQLGIPERQTCQQSTDHTNENTEQVNPV